MGYLVILENKIFDSKAEAQRYFKSQFKKYAGNSLPFLDFIPWQGDESVTLRSLLEKTRKWKPEYCKGKVGQEKDDFGHWRPALRLPNGDRKYFGLTASLNNAVNPEQAHYQNFLKVLRNSLRDVIVSFREKEFVKGEVYCPYTGEKLTINNCHVDHSDPSFETIAKEFMTYLEDNNVHYGLFKKIRTNNDVPILDNPDIKLWIEFHNKRACLEIISVAANLSKGNHTAPRGGAV